MSAPWNIDPVKPLICVSRNHNETQKTLAHIRAASIPMINCKWTVYLIDCSVTASPVTIGIGTVPHKDVVNVSLTRIGPLLLKQKDFFDTNFCLVLASLLLNFPTKFL